MILLKKVVHVAIGVLLRMRTARFTDRTRVGIMAVRGHLLRCLASHLQGTREGALAAPMSRVMLSSASTWFPSESIAL